MRRYIVTEELLDEIYNFSVECISDCDDMCQLDSLYKLATTNPYTQIEMELLNNIENFACACVWSNASDCPGTSDGEMICDGCEYFEYADPEDLRNYIKTKLEELRGGSDE